MKWSDGDAGHRRGRVLLAAQLDVDAIKNEATRRHRLLDPSLKDAGVTTVECPDASRR